MNLYVALDRHLYGGGGAQRYLWVRVEVPRLPSKNASRAPFDIQLVLDRSGSMSGSKMEYTKCAAATAVNLLERPTDAGWLLTTTRSFHSRRAAVSTGASDRG